jgi:hypothetical protein
MLWISNKYESRTWNKFLMKMLLLWNNMTYIQNTHRFRGFKLTFADWLKFSLIKKLMSNFKKKFWLRMRWTWFEAPPSRIYMFGCVIVSWQLHFHIYYLFVVAMAKRYLENFIDTPREHIERSIKIKENYNFSVNSYKYTSCLHTRDTMQMC